MRLSTKRRLAVNAMIDLALREPAGPVALATIAQRQQASLSSLEQLFARLRVAGLVTSTRGAGGGYSLGRDVADISVAAIVAAVEGDLPDEDAAGGRTPLSTDLWQRLEAVMQAHMAGIGLDELVAGQREAGFNVDLRPRRKVDATRPQSHHSTFSVPNSVFDLGAVMARADARASGR